MFVFFSLAYTEVIVLKTFLRSGSGGFAKKLKVKTKVNMATQTLASYSLLCLTKLNKKCASATETLNYTPNRGDRDLL